MVKSILQGGCIVLISSISLLPPNKMRIRVAFKKFNISNTGLDKANKYPELSTTFKAAFLKSSLWFFAKVAIQISENHPEESGQTCFLVHVWFEKRRYQNQVVVVVVVFDCVSKIGLYVKTDCGMPLPHLCRILCDGSFWHSAWWVGFKWPFGFTWVICMCCFVVVIPSFWVFRGAFCSWKNISPSRKLLYLPITRNPPKVVANHLQTHLLSWQHLAAQCQMKKMCLYKMRPKHHYLDHIARDVARTSLNPRKTMTCFNDESFLGCLKKIGIRCHAANMMERLLQRYILFLSVRWNDAKGINPAVGRRWKKRNWVPVRALATWEATTVAHMESFDLVW